MNINNPVPPTQVVTVANFPNPQNVDVTNFPAHDADTASDSALGQAANGTTLLRVTRPQVKRFDGTFGPVFADDSNNDGLGAGTIGVWENARLMGFNNATWDRLRIDQEGGSIGGLRIAKFADYIVRNGGAFIGAGALNAVAAAYGSVQLANPVGSSVWLYLDKIVVSSGGAEQVVLVFDGTLQTSPATMQNKNLGGAAPVGIVYNNNVAGFTGTAVGQHDILAGQPLTLEFKPAIRIPAGHRVQIQNVTANLTQAASFEWREYAA